MIKRSPHSGLPPAPTGLVASIVGSCEVILAWTEGEAGALGFRIERAAGNDSGSSFSRIGSVGPHVTAFRDGSVNPQAIYSYRVRAWNASGTSSSSNVVEVNTLQDRADYSAE